MYIFILYYIILYVIYIYIYYILYICVYQHLWLQQLYVHISISTVVAPGSPVEAFRPRGDDATVLVETCRGGIGVDVMSGCHGDIISTLW